MSQLEISLAHKSNHGVTVSCNGQPSHEFDLRSLVPSETVPQPLEQPKIYGAPIFFAIVLLVYFRKFNFTTPLQTAIVFIAFVIAMDFFIVAILINRSFEMFTSLLGTWIPFALIFTSTYVTGKTVTRQ